MENLQEKNKELESELKRVKKINIASKKQK
jgi:hypothetical protein